jgi:hypothetical protein
MYFLLTGDIQYDVKPIKFPFSQSDYVVAKNFFRRFKIDEDKFNYSVYFNRYAMKEGDRYDLIAERAYGTPLYDWVIILTNNIIDPLFGGALTEYQVRELTENPDGVHHYETVEFKNTDGQVVLEGGLIVDQTFTTKPFVYVNQTQGNILTYSQRPGTEVTKVVTNLEQAIRENESNREIYILKPKYLRQFVDDFKKQSFYFKSSNYIDNQLKKAGV